MGGGGRQLISVYPEELTFDVVLEKPCYCDLKVVNNTEHHVAYKVKTTSPKKYFVRPNTGVVQPWDSCFIRVTLQAQREYPPDMQCKDKFLLLSTTVPSSTDLDEVPPDTFSKDGGKTIEECKLRVVYADSQHPGHGDESGLTSSMSRVSELSSDNASVQTIQRLKEDRDATLQLNQQLQREMDMLMRRRSRKSSDTGFSFRFAVFVGIIGIMVGFILNLTLSSPPLG